MASALVELTRSGCLELVFHCLDVCDVLSLLHVCVEWRRQCENSVRLWKSLCYSTRPVCSHLAPLRLDESRCLSLSAKEWKSLFATLCIAGSRRFGYSLLGSGVFQSSCDAPNQTIASTLTNIDEEFWSSTGREHSDGEDDELIYSLSQGVCIVQRVSILPFRAHFQQGLPVYAPKKIRICLQINKKRESTVYQSEWFCVNNTHNEQSFYIGSSVHFARFVRFELRGRSMKQPIDELYYTCLQRVRAQGIPLGVLSCSVLTKISFHESSLYFRKRRSLSQFMQMNDLECMTVKETFCRHQKILKSIVSVRKLTEQFIMYLASSVLFECSMSSTGGIARLRFEVLSIIQSLSLERCALYIWHLWFAGVERLNNDEMITFCKYWARQYRPNRMDFLLARNERISMSEALGDLFISYNQFPTATQIYWHSSVIDKFLGTLARTRTDQAALVMMLSLCVNREDTIRSLREVTVILKRHHHNFIHTFFVHRAMRLQAITPQQAVSWLNLSENPHDLPRSERLVQNHFEEMYSEFRRTRAEEFARFEDEATMLNDLFGNVIHEENRVDNFEHAPVGEYFVM